MSSRRQWSISSQNVVQVINCGNTGNVKDNKKWNWIIPKAGKLKKDRIIKEVKLEELPPSEPIWTGLEK